MQTKYTPEINQFIIDNRQQHTVKELSKLLIDNFGIKCAVKGLATHLSRTLNIKIPSHKFPEELNEVIRQTTLGRTVKEQVKEIKDLTGIELTINQVKGARSRHNLKSGLTGCFKPGSIPANKGKKMSPEQREKCSKSWFIRGNIPYNTVPVGTRRKRDDGYWWEKIAEPNKWRQIHVLEWEKHNGPKPKSAIIAFLDGDTSNWNIDNLELVSRGDWAICNKFYPLEKNHPDLNLLSITAARLRRIANARARDLKEETK